MVGFAACTDEELAWLYVEPAHMRKGMEMQLMEFFYSSFRRSLILRHWSETSRQKRSMKPWDLRVLA